jgi:FkbM family methyltransferase
MRTARRYLEALFNPGRLAEVARCRRASPQWLELTAKYIGYPFRPFKIDLPSGPFEFREHGDVATFWQIFFANLYDVRPSDRLVVDAGGNIGTFSLYALLQAPGSRVIAVEPSGSTFERLQWVLNANGVANRATPIHAALGGSDGITSISTAGPSHMRVAGVPGGEEVRQVALESILPPNEEVDLLKMDIEGAEYATLSATPRRVLDRIRRIELEYHPDFGREHQWPALRKRLCDAGFEVVLDSEDEDKFGMARLVRAQPAAALRA